MPKRKEAAYTIANYTVPITLSVFEWARLLRILHREHPDRPLLEGINKAVQRQAKLANAVSCLRVYDEAERFVRLYGGKPAKIRAMISSDFEKHELKVLATQTGSWGRPAPKETKSRRVSRDKKVVK
jgi:hypothetical protein